MRRVSCVYTVITTHTRQEIEMSKWYVVPRYVWPINRQVSDPLSRPADVIDENGEQVARFETLELAERAVEAFNAYQAMPRTGQIMEVPR